jgi:hypothetical protein
MPIIASIITDATTEIGLMAGSIAVGGFLAHAPAALQGRDEMALRIATVRGGLGGIGVAVLVNFGAVLL